MQTFAYDEAARLIEVRSETNGAVTDFVYGPFYQLTFQTINANDAPLYQFQVFNGLGQVFFAGSNHPGSAGGYRAQWTWLQPGWRVDEHLRCPGAQVNYNYDSAGRLTSMPATGYSAVTNFYSTRVKYYLHSSVLGNTISEFNSDGLRELPCDL